MWFVVRAAEGGNGRAVVAPPGDNGCAAVAAACGKANTCDFMDIVATTYIVVEKFKALRHSEEGSDSYCSFLRRA